MGRGSSPSHRATFPRLPKMSSQRRGTCPILSQNRQTTGIKKATLEPPFTLPDWFPPHRLCSRHRSTSCRIASPNEIPAFRASSTKPLATSSVTFGSGKIAP